jgi:hypothetical protein
LENKTEGKNIVPHLRILCCLATSEKMSASTFYEMEEETDCAANRCLLQGRPLCKTCSTTPKNPPLEPCEEQLPRLPLRRCDATLNSDTLAKKLDFEFAMKID